MGRAKTAAKKMAKEQEQRAKAMKTVANTKTPKTVANKSTRKR